MATEIKKWLPMTYGYSLEGVFVYYVRWQKYDVS